MSDNSLESAQRELFDIETRTVDAFRRKDAAAFTRHFDARYVGVAADGVKTADGEVEGMRKLDLESIGVEDRRAVFHGPDLAILTYTMAVRGRLGATDISGDIHASTVYLRQDGGWTAILHTEAMAG